MKWTVVLLRLINAFAGPYVLSHRVHARHVTSRIDSNKLIEFPRYRAQSPVSPILFRGHNFGFSTSRQADKRVCCSRSIAPTHQNNNELYSRYFSWGNRTHTTMTNPNSIREKHRDFSLIRFWCCCCCCALLPEVSYLLRSTCSELFAQSA